MGMSKMGLSSINLYKSINPISKWGFLKWGYPKYAWFNNGKSHLEMDDLGVHFRNTHHIGFLVSPTWPVRPTCWARHRRPRCDRSDKWNPNARVARKLQLCVDGKHICKWISISMWWIGMNLLWNDMKRWKKTSRRGKYVTILGDLHWSKLSLRLIQVRLDNILYFLVNRHVYKMVYGARAWHILLIAMDCNKEVSINGELPRNGCIRIPWKWMIWRYPYFRKPPYTVVCLKIANSGNK